MRAHGAFRGEQARWAIACALVTAAAVAVAGEPTAPARPPAVRPERPRLFLTPATAAALPARARGELAWIYRDRIIRDCDAPFDERRVEFTLGNADYLLARGLSLLLAYRIERREEYKSRAMSLVNGLRSDGAAKTRRDVRLRMQFLAIAYDWLYDALSAEERSALRTLLADAYRKEAGVLSKTDDDFVSGYSHFTTTSLVIAACPSATARASTRPSWTARCGTGKGFSAWRGKSARMEDSTWAGATAVRTPRASRG